MEDGFYFTVEKYDMMDSEFRINFSNYVCWDCWNSKSFGLKPITIDIEIIYNLMDHLPHLIFAASMENLDIPIPSLSIRSANHDIIPTINRKLKCELMGISLVNARLVWKLDQREFRNLTISNILE